MALFAPNSKAYAEAMSHDQRREHHSGNQTVDRQGTRRDACGVPRDRVHVKDQPPDRKTKALQKISLRYDHFTGGAQLLR